MQQRAPGTHSQGAAPRPRAGKRPGRQARLWVRKPRARWGALDQSKGRRARMAEAGAPAGLQRLHPGPAEGTPSPGAQARDCAVAGRARLTQAACEPTAGQRRPRRAVPPPAVGGQGDTDPHPFTSWRWNWLCRDGQWRHREKTAIQTKIKCQGHLISIRGALVLKVTGAQRGRPTRTGPHQGPDHSQEEAPVAIFM